jgi:tripartite-type tricarboxylate transporter receptor subunit TctC
MIKILRKVKICVMSSFCTILVLGSITIFSQESLAQTYPNRQIRFIDPHQPGGATDTISRIVARALAEGLGQPVVTENRPGAGTTVGTEIVVNSKPDGYTIVLGSASITISPSFYRKLRYDTTKDLAPISMVALGHQVFVVHPSLPVNDIKELVAYAKTNPGKLNYGSSGVGGPGHLAGELLKSLTQINIVRR